MNNSTSRIFSMSAMSFSGLLLLLLSFTLATAQVPTAQPTPLTSNSTFVSQQPATATASPTPLEQEARLVYGLQGVLIETPDGKTVASQAPDVTFNPASAVKLATALVALRTFGPRHRFTTGFWTDGTFDKASGTINGNLYVSGRDPSFHYEHAVMIARQLNNLGIRTVSGDLVVAPGFTMNFNWSARRSGERLYDVLDSTLRPAEATSAWNYSRTLLGDAPSLVTVPSVAVMGDVTVSPVAPGARLLFTHHSGKLTDILKVLLCYSNNFMAERLGDSVGGVGSVERVLTNDFGIPAAEVKLASLSGLGVNRVTPRAMMKIFRALREELRKYKLSTTDILPVAGIDPGTLQDRFTETGWRGSVIGKTGTLVRTDGGASSLVGQMKTASGEILLFVIFNQRGNVWKFRENQDYLIKQTQSTRGGPRAFDYVPLALPMRLADTRSTVPSETEEYEPIRANGNPR
jgi:D-alanyl-D-alanine carboxypeptidase/D-alanyl-D-alanine-endopeptidase (penicillin-binding protein 4)